MTRASSPESRTGLTKGQGRGGLLTSIIFSVIVVGWTSALAQSGDSANSSFAAQPDATVPPAPAIHGQPGDDHTLEIAPQPGSGLPDQGIKEVPSGRDFKPGEDTSSLEKNFRPDQTPPVEGNHRPPCIGFEVRYATKCFLGGEERGMEILSVDPNSPAERAGLRGNRGGVGAASIATAMLGPLSLLVNGMLERATENASGDLIVAVNDHRVRSQLDIDDELYKLKPGDTMYVTVIRPLPGGAHKTMKVEVKVGEPGTCKTPSQAQPRRFSPDDENFAY